MSEWSDFLPEYVEASKLERNLVFLDNYFGQSSGQSAKALCKHISTVFPGNVSPRFLAPATIDDKESEESKTALLRHKYWTDKLRPLLADSSFMTDITKITVRIKDAQYTTEQRDMAVQEIKSSIGYWDAHFAKD